MTHFLELTETWVQIGDGMTEGINHPLEMVICIGKEYKEMEEYRGKLVYLVGKSPGDELCDLTLSALNILLCWRASFQRWSKE